MFSLVNYTNVMLLGSYFIGVADLRFHKYTVALASVLILFSCKKKCKMFFFKSCGYAIFVVWSKIALKLWLFPFPLL